MNEDNKLMYKFYEREIVSADDESKVFEIIKEDRTFFDKLANEIVKSIKKGNYFVAFQPHIENDVCNGAEALFRLKIDDMPINPMVVFSIASYYGFEEQLTLNMLKSICPNIKRFREIDDDFRVSFNVNPKLFNRNFCYKMFKILNDNGVRAKNVAVELVETSSFEDIDVSDIKLLQKNGVQVYLDDFGSGYATQEVLKLPFDVVKFDGELIKDIDKNVSNQRVVKSIVELCKLRKAKTLAERVETKQELDTVKKLGVDKIQGYYYSKPLIANELLEKYTEKEL